MYASILLLLIACQCTIAEKSFTVVLDTTNSMNDDINIIKANMEQVVKSVDANDFSNFVLVSFKETVVEPVLVTPSGETLMRRLNSFTTSGGTGCLENSLGAIKTALSTSEKHSPIFVFTDAYAKDYENIQSVENLCKESLSQVMIFLSGYCSPSHISQASNVDIYYNLAKSCSGAVLVFDPVFELREVFRYMKEIIGTDWTDVTTHEQFANFKTFSFSVDSFTTDLMIVASGENPSIQITSDSRGSVQVETILKTKYARVVRFINPIVFGEYSANIRGQGMVYVTVYNRTYVPFEFGFSTKPPRNIKETTSKPIPGVLNYILINVAVSVKLRSVEWLIFGDNTKQIFYLTELLSGSYIGSIYVNPDKMFRFWIIGEDIETHQELRGSSKFISPQKSVSKPQFLAPEIEILDKESILVDYGKDITLACKVAAYPKADIQWKDETGNYLTSEDALLEIPYIHISYATISRVSNNSTISCNAENEVGTTSMSIDIFVNRTFTFDVIQSPENVSVEYESSQYLYCQVDAYPKARISWYFNDSLIDADTNMRIAYEENALVIKKMGFEDVGVYECRATNEIETKRFPAIVTITGVESPEVDSTDTDISLKRGDFAVIECRIKKGKPAPAIEWQYKTFTSDVFSALPFGASVQFDKLQINSAQNDHAGVYRCIASNFIGENYLDFYVNIKYAPIIKEKEKEIMLVLKNQEVCIPCQAEAMPAPTVRWEFVQDSAYKTFDQRHRTDDKNNLCFKAVPQDGGDYRCIAENDVGKAERVVTVLIQVPPYIESPKESNIDVKVGTNVDLVCKVLDGTPEPNIKWEFKKEGSSEYAVLKRGVSTLNLINLSQYDEGEYVCIADNSIGFDTISYKLSVV